MANGAILDDGGRGASASLLAGAELGDWVALLKPRVVSLVVFTGLVGLLVAPGASAPCAGHRGGAVHRRRRRGGGGDQHVV